MKDIENAVKGCEEHENDLILRDYLAIDRTLLANERTLLAYIRTCLGFFAAGIALISFIEQNALIYIGYIFMGTPIFIFIFGIYRFVNTRRKIIKAYDVEDKT